MKHDYLISYYDSTPSFFDEGGNYIDVFGGAGWYVQVSDLTSWGPFLTQREAIESLLVEWPRFESNFFIESNQTGES